MRPHKRALIEAEYERLRRDNLLLARATLGARKQPKGEAPMGFEFRVWPAVFCSVSSFCSFFFKNHKKNQKNLVYLLFGGKNKKGLVYW